MDSANVGLAVQLLHLHSIIYAYVCVNLTQLTYVNSHMVADSTVWRHVQVYNVLALLLKVPLYYR